MAEYFIRFLETLQWEGYIEAESEQDLLDNWNKYIVFQNCDADCVNMELLHHQKWGEEE